MRYSLLLGAVSGLAAAMPAPGPSATGAMDFFDILNVPQPTAKGAAPGVIMSSASKYAASTITPVAAESAATALAKRQEAETITYDSSVASAQCASSNSCCPLATNSALAAGTDTPDAFTTDAAFASMATSAPTPPGYTQVFSNQNAAIQEVGYRGVYTYNTYDVASCALQCSSDNLCFGFNTYIERNPIVKPDYSSCTNPPSTAFVKCTLYGYPISTSGLTNVGQYQSAFHVVVAASNGYNKLRLPSPPTVPNFNAPSSLLPGAIDSPHYYLFEFYNTISFDPSVCAAGCQRNTAWNAAHPHDSSYKACNMFNAYVLFVDDLAQGTYCAFFDQPVDDSYATNVGQYRGDTHITVGLSYTYVLSQQDPGSLQTQ